MFVGGLENSAREWMFACAFHARRQPERFKVTRRVCGGERRYTRLPFRQGAGFVDYQRVDFLQTFQRFGIFDQHSGVSAAAGADHDGHRRRESKAQGQAMISTATALTMRVGKTRLGPKIAQAMNVSDGNAMTAGTNHAGNSFSQALNGRAAALRLADHV